MPRLQAIVRLVARASGGDYLLVPAQTYVPIFGSGDLPARRTPLPADEPSEQLAGLRGDLRPSTGNGRTIGILYPGG